MTIYKDKRVMPFEAELIRDVILDVEKYPEFLPWCHNATVISRDKKGVVADLSISFANLTETYRSLIKTSYKEGVYNIEINAISGPFEHLNTIWSIKKLNKTSEVDFFIDFELKSRILSIVVGGLFSIATERMISAFEVRARKVSVANV